MSSDDHYWLGRQIGMEDKSERKDKSEQKDKSERFLFRACLNQIQ